MMTSRLQLFSVRMAIILALATLSMMSQARPEFLQILKNHYKFDPSSALGAAGCNACHAGPPAKNPYGKTLQKLIKASGGDDLTDQILTQAESEDSDGDGWSNGDELKKGFLPGDPTNHPAGTPPPKTASSTPTVSPGSGGSTGSSLFPSNGFHPVVIHFPIALFLFGAFLEFLGIWKKNPNMNVAALWNLIGGIVSLTVVAPTGVAAWLIGQHKLEGNMLIHLILAISSLILMAATLAVRKKLGYESKVYWAVLVLSAVVVGLTGHFGGQMVYG